MVGFCVVLVLRASIWFCKGWHPVPPVTGGTCYLDCTKPIQLLGRAASSVGVMYRSSGPNTWSNPRESADTKKKKKTSQKMQ